MGQVLVLLLIALAAGTIARAWWGGRIARDPIGTASDFGRALSAMRPEEEVG